MLINQEKYFKIDIVYSPSEIIPNENEDNEFLEDKLNIWSRICQK